MKKQSVCCSCDFQLHMVRGIRRGDRRLWPYIRLCLAGKISSFIFYLYFRVSKSWSHFGDAHTKNTFIGDGRPNMMMGPYLNCGICPKLEWGLKIALIALAESSSACFTFYSVNIHWANYFQTIENVISPLDDMLIIYVLKLYNWLCFLFNHSSCLSLTLLYSHSSSLSLYLSLSLSLSLSVSFSLHHLYIWVCLKYYIV